MPMGHEKLDKHNRADGLGHVTVDKNNSADGLGHEIVDKNNSADGLGHEIVDNNNSADGLGHEIVDKKNNARKVFVSSFWQVSKSWGFSRRVYIPKCSKTNFAEPVVFCAWHAQFTFSLWICSVFLFRSVPWHSKFVFSLRFPHVFCDPSV